MIANAYNPCRLVLAMTHGFSITLRSQDGEFRFETRPSCEELFSEDDSNQCENPKRQDQRREHTYL